MFKVVGHSQHRGCFVTLGVFHIVGVHNIWYHDGYVTLCWDRLDKDCRGEDGHFFLGILDEDDVVVTI